MVKVTKCFRQRDRLFSGETARAQAVKKIL